MTIKIPFKNRTWKDKNGTWLIYSKEFHISAYGKTRKEAKDMFVFQVYEFLKMSKPKNK